MIYIEPYRPHFPLLPKQPILQTGDIFFTDSGSTASKIVKFLTAAPTVWQHLWRKLRETQQEVRFYHAGMILDGEYLIEQERVVEINSTPKIFKRDKYIIWRKRNITAREQTTLLTSALDDLGEGYDILLCVGKLFTWLTGIPMFTRWVQQREKEICITRVAYWYWQIGETFGCKTWHEVTTDIMDDWCYEHLNEWMIVAIKYKEE